MEGSAALSKEPRANKSWRGFKSGSWCNTIDVRDFIVKNVTPYSGDEKFLSRTDQAHQGGVGQASAVFSG